MFCAKCGKPLSDNAKFCPACGAPAGREGVSADPAAGQTLTQSETARILRELPYPEQFPLLAVSERLYAMPETAEPESLALAAACVCALLKRLKERRGIAPVDYRTDPVRSARSFVTQLHGALEARDRANAQQPGYAAPAASIRKTDKLLLDPAALRSFMESLAKDEKHILVSCALYALQISRSGTLDQFTAAAQYLCGMLEALQTQQGIRGITLRKETLNADALRYVELVEQGTRMKAAKTAEQTAAKTAEQTAAKTAEQTEVHFRTVEEADNWLRTQDRIRVRQMNVRTHVGGGFGMHALEIDDICFRVERLNAPTAFRYGFTSEKSTKLYVKGDLDAFAKEWAARNPQLQYVSGLKRTASGALVGGVGYLKFNNEHYFVLYSYRIAT